MPESVFESRSRWGIAAAGAVVVIVAVLFLFRLPAPVAGLAPPLISSAPKASVQMARPDNSDRLLKQEAELRDLRPLFLPTERNAALPEPRLEPGRTFLETELRKPIVTDTEAQVSKALPPVVTLDGQPVAKATAVDVLSPLENRMALHGIGRNEPSLVPFTARGGYVEATSLKDGVRVLGEGLSADARPPSGKSWTPVEFIAVIDAAGLASPLVVTEGSRVDEVDAHFRNYLERNFRIGERLSPGFYRITVAP